MHQLQNNMGKKSVRANNAFLIGSVLMIVLVLLVVVLFVFLSFKIYEKEEFTFNERYDIKIEQNAVNHPVTLYLNDSLLFQGTPGAPMTLSIERFELESTLLVVNDETDMVSILPLPAKSAKVSVGIDSLGYLSDGETVSIER